MSNSLFGFPLDAALDKITWSAPKMQKDSRSAIAKVVFFGRGEKLSTAEVGAVPLNWQWSKEPAMIEKLSGEQGPVWVVKSEDLKMAHHHGQFDVSAYSMARDTVGSIFREAQGFETFHFIYIGKDEAELKGALVGMEIASYRFKNLWPKAGGRRPVVYVESKLKSAKAVATSARNLGHGINLARHLVNLPPNILHPESYAELIQTLFRGSKAKVEVWKTETLKKEKMGLLMGVGQGAKSGPCLVKISYRQGGKKNPYAFVGKGITFDSGGLDIKPSAGMRDMKKDMGGSASVLGLCYWMEKQNVKINADFYLAIAENSVSENAFRPGDILISRSGKTVEIHNTDAEGRLVLADALSVAVDGKPQFIVDVATLTGAIKVAMGEQLPGVFSNNDKLADDLMKAGRTVGDNCWRMPLDPGQKGKLKSEVADLVNATDGFGGAVTAALFLEMFVAGTPWAHFDIYSWVGSATGAYSERGGNGQTVQCLANLCENLT
jgi:leucyl aminopeptidase